MTQDIKEPETLKAYSVFGSDGEYEAADLVFAHGRGEAKRIGMRGNACDGLDFVDIKTRRVPSVEGMNNKPTAYIEHRVEVLRAAGFHRDGDLTCDSCGLHDFDEDKFAVCGECHQCPECGHEDDCTEKQS